MRRAELVEQVRRLADQTAYLAAEVRRGDTAIELLGQVRDFGHRLPPGLAAEIRRVVDDMVATRHEAQAGPHSPAAGTSSAGGSGQRPPDAPSTQPAPQVGDIYENARLGRYRLVRIELDGWYPHHVESVDAVDGGDGHDQRIVDLDNTDDRFARWTLVERDGRPYPPAREPEPVAVEVTPRKGEVWQDDGGLRVRLHRPALATGAPRREWVWIAEVVESGWRGMREVGDTITDVELDRDGWTLIEVTPDVQCPKCEGNGDIVHTPGDPGIVCDACDGSGEQEPAREAGVEPATDEQIAELVDCHVEFYWAGGEAIRPLVARVRQEQGQATEFLNGRTRWQGRAQIAEGQVQRLIGERDEAVDRTYAAVDRANAAEAALARVERVTDLERDVVQAAQAHTAANVPTTWHLLRDAVRALRDAQEEGQ